MKRFLLGIGLLSVLGTNVSYGTKMIYTGREASFKRAVLNKHNEYRSIHGADKLSWSTSLALTARNWAQHLAATCYTGHDPHSENGYGENIYRSWTDGSSYPKINGAQLTNAWYNEEKDYDYNTGESKNGNEIGHFTQVVSKRSGKIGCAAVGNRCGAKLRTFYVCNYDPHGNITGQNKRNVGRKNWLQAGQCVGAPHCKRIDNQYTCSKTSGCIWHVSIIEN